jgi:Phosphotransferase enzyme family
MNKQFQTTNTTESKPNIVLRNTPIQSEHAVEESFNQMRLEFVPYIQDFVREHELFKKEREVGITFPQKGVGSVIAIIEGESNTYVLKIPRSIAYSAGESQFLKVWKSVGVKVPHVHETGVLHNYPYTLLEYIDAPILDEKYTHEELVQKGIYKEMGEVFRKMHTLKVQGFGFVVDGEPEFESFDDWLMGEDMKKRFEYVYENSLLGDEKVYVAKALEVIKEYSLQAGSTYCHDDFAPHNIFATKPITIFDTNPKFNTGYYDLGRSFMGSIAYNRPEASRRQLLEGYFADSEYDKRVLDAYILLACCMKFTYWHKTGRSEEMQRVLEYISQNHG